MWRSVGVSVAPWHWSMWISVRKIHFDNSCTIRQSGACCNTVRTGCPRHYWRHGMESSYWSNSQWICKNAVENSSSRIQDGNFTDRLPPFGFRTQFLFRIDPSASQKGRPNSRRENTSQFIAPCLCGCRLETSLWSGFVQKTWQGFFPCRNFPLCYSSESLSREKLNRSSWETSFATCAKIVSAFRFRLSARQWQIESRNRLMAIYSKFEVSIVTLILQNVPVLTIIWRGNRFCSLVSIVSTTVTNQIEEWFDGHLFYISSFDCEVNFAKCASLDNHLTLEIDGMYLQNN